MTKFYLERTVSADRDAVFQIMSDFASYQRLLPQHFPSVRIRSTRGNVSVVEEHRNLGRYELVIMAKHVTQRPVSHHVFVIGGDAKGSHFKEEFTETVNGTKISAEVDLKLKGRMRITALLGRYEFEKDYGRITDDLLGLLKD